jgi:hypothetical protein
LPAPSNSHHGQPEEETSSEDVEAQAPEAPEGEPTQKAHLAEIILLLFFASEPALLARRVFILAGS